MENFPLLTVREFAARAKIGAKLVYELANAGSLPGAVRLGRTWRFSWEVFLREGGVRPVPPLTPIRRPRDFVRSDLDRLLTRPIE